MLPSRKYYLDSIFDNFMDDSYSFDVMKCDIYEKDDNYYIEADMPGYKKEEINIDSENGYITISAEKSNEKEETGNDKKYIKRERYYGKVIRKFYVGDINEDKVRADFKDGILKIVVPKEEKIPNKKSIEIK